MRFSEAKPKILTQLGDLTALQISQLVSESLIDKGISPRRDDFVLSSPEFDFYIEYKSKSTTETIGAAIHAGQPHPDRLDKPSIFLIVVPYMGEIGKAMCKQAGVSWMDLSGNALIHADGLHVNVSGYPNQFANRGRPKNIFAPSAARITRLLLQESAIKWDSQTLVDRTSLSKGYVSKILRRLEEANLIIRERHGAISPANSEMLLEAWSKSYSFEDHFIKKGHIATRSSGDLLEKIVGTFRSHLIECAATGLASAWQYNQFAQYRLVTIYVDMMPDEDIFDQIHFREVDSGANIWIVKPNDPGVFNGTMDLNGVDCVSPIQTYLDLQHLPERADEATDMIRSIIQLG